MNICLIFTVPDAPPAFLATYNRDADQHANSPFFPSLCEPNASDAPLTRRQCPYTGSSPLLRVLTFPGADVVADCWQNASQSPSVRAEMIYTYVLVDVHPRSRDATGLPGDLPQRLVRPTFSLVTRLKSELRPSLPIHTGRSSRYPSSGLNDFAFAFPSPTPPRHEAQRLMVASDVTAHRQSRPSSFTPTPTSTSYASRSFGCTMTSSTCRRGSRAFGDMESSSLRKSSSTSDPEPSARLVQL
jgi:hypothetical protein